MTQRRITALAAALGLSLAGSVCAQQQQPPQAQQQPSDGVSTPSTADATQAPAQDSQTVRQVQQQLKDQGHEIAVDGQMGPQTQAALKDFQQQQGMEANGELDARTLAALGVTGGSTGGATGGMGSSTTPTR
jgi:peptidoglycan hydrolase-like protein with peptidoglycan-binding domain